MRTADSGALLPDLDRRKGYRWRRRANPHLGRPDAVSEPSAVALQADGLPSEFPIVP
jgi:hypothetical protein